MFAGVIVPMVTPFDASGEHVDLAAMRVHVKWLLDKPVSLLFPISGLGQWRKLTLTEKQDIIRTVVNAAGGVKPVSPGITSMNSLAETVELARFAEHAGAAAVSVAIPEALRPKGGPPPQSTLYSFYRAVHDETGVPVLIYDAQADLQPETMRRLAELPRIKAIKYRTKDIERILRMARAAGDRVAVLAGVEHEGVAALAAGAVGIVGGGANVFPQLIDRVIRRFRAGDVAGARAATFDLIEANDGVPGGQEIKYALSRFYGLPLKDSSRGNPEEPLSIAEKDRLDSAMLKADPGLATPKTERAKLAAAGQERRQRYLALTSATADADGFVHNKCDGATFTALSCVARGLRREDCPVYKAEDGAEPGRWYRHARHDCFQGDGTAGGSRSDNSPDVFISLALAFWQYRDLAAVSRIIAYGESHRWVMGRSRAGIEGETVAWNDDLKALYYELRFRLGGPDSPERAQLDRSPDLGEGWAAHVAANRLLLVALLTGDLMRDELDALQELAQREPHNGLYQALNARLGDGDERDAWRALLDERHFPATRLPDRREHCEEYLFQRDERDGASPNANWLPCPGGPAKPHSGTDLLWSACVLTPGCLRT
jgi:4-hydroxy-tetrahydrodipicolinate synthase